LRGREGKCERRHEHRIKYLPNVFTEHGATQAANVLSSPRAIEMSVYVVRAFVKLRGALATTKELASTKEDESTRSQAPANRVHSKPRREVLPQD
jgi:hypothetical protein